YIASLNPRTLYVRTELSHNNESYVVPDLKGVTLQQHYDAIKAMVKQKTGRAMQEKKVTVIGKNGKPKERNGSSPIRESVVNIKPDTTMSDLLKYTEKVRQRWGVRAIQIHIHKDEGHYTNPDDPSTWQPNLHAHIIWDWMNHETGKSFKLGKKDMEELQDMAAETLEMERGKRKSETGAEHLERNDYILSEQKKQSAKLDAEIAEKRDRLDTENGNAIKSGVANLFGKGKYADMEKENKRLKEELPKHKAILQRKYQQALDAERDKQSQQLAEKDKMIEELQAKYEGEIFRHQQDNQEKEKIIHLKESIINDYRERLDHYLSTLSELLRDAVKAVFDYIQSGYRSFSYRQEGDVRRYMNSQSDKEVAAGTILNASLPFLKSYECEKVKGQLSYIVQDMKEERQQNQSRGFHL
ncbi:MAG: mobilization protein, partial [Prevotella sp.]|nr:mobilization protein [Prevotella sp.]